MSPVDLHPRLDRLAVRKPLARLWPLGKDGVMTREQVESAMARGVPLTLRMADGKEYFVPHRD